MAESTGERVARVGAEEYVLTPTWNAIREIEERTGAGLRTAWAKIQNEGHVGTTALCLWALNTNGGRKNKSRNLDFFGELVVRHGVMAFVVDIATIIAGVVSRGAATRSEAPPDEGGEDKSAGRAELAAS